jgi:hypothetical protein
MLMINEFLPPKRRANNLHPRVREHASRIVVGDHSRDRFRPPQEVAAEEETKNTTAIGPEPPHQQPPKTSRSLKERLKNLSKKQKILLTLAAAVVVSGAIIGTYFAFFAEKPHKPIAVITNKEPEKEPKPTTVPSNLSGLQVDPSINERPVTAAMIENSPSARPQAGLLEAGVVFEAIAEGGITRFVALFQDTEPDYVGPVRSARPYYMTWLLGFDATYAHAGGSAEALSLINQWRVKDLPHDNNHYWRINSRAAPHNLYTSIPKLREYAAAKGYGKSNFTPLPRKDKEEPIATPTARSIDFNISQATYNVHYDYDPATNSYKRNEGGAPHTDERSGAQLSPKVVVALIMPQGRNGIYYTYQTVGSGQVFIFQDGEVKTGTWRKDSNEANLTFTDDSGAEIKLNPGQTWFTALGDAGRVSYTP